MKHILMALIFTVTSLNAQQPVFNSLGMSFVPVEKTQVLFCRHETRRQDFEAFDKEQPTTDVLWKTCSIEGKPAGHLPDHPVVCVNFDDAVKFCEWLSKKEGKIYRLPTDKEWSYAVGNGNSEKWVKSATPESLNFGGLDDFPWGNKKSPMTGNYGDTSWVQAFPGNPYVSAYTDGFVTTAPVMSFRPNKFGLYDMGGNVSEWVSDWWNNERLEHTLRGGGWQSSGKLLYSAARYTKAESLTRYYKSFGFRVVMEASKK